MKYGFLLAAIALLIVAHRAYLMFSPAIYMMLLTGIYVNRTKETITSISLFLTNKTIKMKILIVASYNCGEYSPFVLEQAESTNELNIQIDYFPVIGKGFRGYLSNRKNS